MADAGRRTITTAACMHNHPTAYQPRSKLKRSLGLIGAVGLLVALIGSYCAYWVIVAQQLRVGLEAWVLQQDQFGNSVSFKWDGISGFPFRFAATFRDVTVRFRDPRAIILWKTSVLEAEMAPWNLHRIDVKSDSPHESSLRSLEDSSEWNLAATALAGTVDLQDSGAFRGFSVALQQPDLALPDGTALASGAATVALDRPAIPPVDYTMPLGRMSLEVRNMALPAGTRLLTEDSVSMLAFDATIKGPMPLAPLRSALAGWRDIGGVLELERFAFAQGPLGLTGNATLALDPDLQPEGAGTVTSTGLGQAVEILIQDGLIPPDRALAARATVKALEKPGPNGKPQATIGLSLQNRTVSFGPVPLFALQRIEWP
jgi:hypothetical protein